MTSSYLYVLTYLNFFVGNNRIQFITSISFSTINDTSCVTNKIIQSPPKVQSITQLTSR